MRFRADEQGVHVSPRLAGSFDVLFDGHPAWSFSVEPRGWRGERLVRWPAAMRPWLHGTAHVELRASGVTEGRRIDLGRLSFGEGSEPIRFVDGGGRPVMIDKWGIVQRPFESRGQEVTAEIAARTVDVIELVRRECGLELWIAFGTLLGAARSGSAIGHDSDVDLLYLSEQRTPAGINLEAYRIKRALDRAGMRTVVKSGSFVTVLFPGPDGIPLGVDIYACFYVGDLLHETATVRAPIPRHAVLPLGTLEFEGLPMPAPAEPEVLLAASYGPGWRVPDPSFRHTPGPEITDRFDAWFGSTMTHRRAWETWWREHGELRPGSALADRLLEDTGGRGPVVEVGAGNGSDAVHLAAAGLQVTATDYARGSWRLAAQEARRRELRVRFERVNLYDLRDTLTAAAELRHRPRPPRALLARGVLDSLHPRGQDAFWRFCRTALHGGGRAYVELDEPATAAGRYRRGDLPPGYAVRRTDVETAAAAQGGRVVAADRVPGDGGSGTGPRRERWQLVVEWP